MDTKSKLTEYYKVFCANIYDGKRMEENLKSIQVALVLLSLFSFIMSVSYLLIADYRMMASAIVLCCLFAGTYISGMRTGKRAMPLILCMLGVMVVFTYYIFSGGNKSFSILWTLLAPVFIMSAVGVKAGTVVGAYFQTIFIIVFWTPLRSIVEEHYSPTFMNHFPILYLCTLIICLAVVLNQKKQQMELDRYQEKLEKAVKAEHDKVTQITFQTIATISSMVDAKDPYTDDHSIRVSHYACVIANELGWSQKEITDLYHAALLHDIGKVGIHDNILKKAAKLSSNEYEIMKTHTSMGASILKDLTFLERADEGALYHHERMDGKGYPYGLKGDNIPLMARLICVADSFDAMNTNRAYRKRCEPSYILEELRKGRGTQFDPDIVDALLRCIEKKLIIFPYEPVDHI